METSFKKPEILALSLVLIVILCVIWSVALPQESPQEKTLEPQQIPPTPVYCPICDHWIPRNEMVSIGRSGKILVCTACFDKMFVWLIQQYMKAKMDIPTKKLFLQ